MVEQALEPGPFLPRALLPGCVVLLSHFASLSLQAHTSHVKRVTARGSSGVMVVLVRTCFALISLTQKVFSAALTRSVSVSPDG